MKSKQLFFVPLVLTASFLGLILLLVQIKKTQEVKDTSAQVETSAELTDPNSGSTSDSIIFEQNISYGPKPEQKLDFCRPKSILGKLPGVILIHGGGGDKKNYESTCKNLANKGYIAATINYREDSPAYPKAVNDAKLALTWLRSRQTVDASKVGTLGGSAGGYLSSLLGTQEFNNKVRCVVDQFGPSDFTDPALQNISFWLETGFPNLFGDVSYQENPDLYLQASTINYVSQNDADLIYLRSVNDNLIPKSQPERLIAAFKKVGKNVPYYEFQGTGGGHAIVVSPLERLRIWNIQIDFLNSCLKS